MAERLRGLGRRAEAEPIYVHPQYSLVHAAHCALGFAASLVAVSVPALGFGLALLAATSMYLDLNGRVYLLRSLFFRRASQNVVSPGSSPEAPARLILCAHLDAARGGAAFAPARAKRFAKLARSSPLPLGPFRLLFWSLALLIPLLGLRMAGVDSGLVSVLQLLPTLVLLMGVFALLEIRLAPVTPGANDNASGVATAISLADELRTEAPDHLDVWVLLDGAGESLGEGVRAFVREHRKQLADRPTFLIGLDSLGGGDVRFLTGGGWALSVAMDRRLVELAEAIAQADDEGDNRYRVKGYASGLGGDAATARLAGLRAIGVTCLDANDLVPNRHLSADVPKAIDSDALDRAHGFARELIRRLDADVGRTDPR
jgi:hypothetical protein